MRGERLCDALKMFCMKCVRGYLRLTYLICLKILSSHLLLLKTALWMIDHKNGNYHSQAKDDSLVSLERNKTFRLELDIIICCTWGASCETRISMIKYFSTQYPAQ